MDQATATNPLYDVGYNDFKNGLELFEAIKISKGYLVDVRFSARARNPQFNGAYLQKTLGSQYVYCHDLGNANYKGGPTEFVNLNSGLVVVMNLLQTAPVFLMCACWLRGQCHRLEICNEIEKRYKITSTPFTVAMARLLVGEQPKLQPKLF